MVAVSQYVEDTQVAERQANSMYGRVKLTDDDRKVNPYPTARDLISGQLPGRGDLNKFIGECNI
jgi:hypothetical protein